MNLTEIETELRTGQVAPPRLAEMKDWLAAESSSLMDRQLELQIAFASFHETYKAGQTEKGLLMQWYRTPNGLEELQLETTQKKIKVLREAVSSHLRVASDMARNNY